MEVIILGANTLYSVFCFFKALLPGQVWSGMAGKRLTMKDTAFVPWCNIMFVLSLFWNVYTVWSWWTDIFFTRKLAPTS